MNPDALLSEYIRPLSPIPTGQSPGGRLTSPIKAILFDVYGTLFISGSGDISVSRNGMPRPEALGRLLKKFKIEQSPETLVGAFFDTIEKTHATLRKEGVDVPEVHIDAIWSQVLGMDHMPTVREFAVEFELLVNPVYPMPNLLRLLNFCNRAGLPMGIISNAQFFTPLLFEWFSSANLRELGFSTDLVILSYEHGCAKPSPRLFDPAVTALEKMGISPASALYIGNDMRNDVGPAARAGFQTALFAGDTRSLRLRTDDPACSNVVPDLVVTDLIQLVDHL